MEEEEEEDDDDDESEDDWSRTSAGEMKFGKQEKPEKTPKTFESVKHRHSNSGSDS